MQIVTEFLSELASKGVKLSARAGQLNCYARKGALTRELADGILRFKPEILALLEARTDDDFALSAGQKGLYILQSMQPKSSAYNVPLCFRINAGIDVRILAQAWNRVLDLFPILTARMVARDGSLYQRYDEGCRTSLQTRPINFTDETELLAFLQEQAKRPFDLANGPLTRIELFTCAGQKSILLLTVHHIVFDGASAVMILKSLVEIYQQLAAGIAVNPQQRAGYQEFVAWEEAMLASPEGASHARYWQQQLAGDFTAVELTPDWPRVPSASLQAATLVADLPADLGVLVRELSKTHSLPPSVIFLAAFQLLLHRYTGQDDLVVGMPVMGRGAPQFATEVGYFINMVPLRAHCGGEGKLLAFLRKTQGTMLDALYHSSYPFPLMSEAVNAGRREKSAIFRTSYAYQNFVNPAAFLSLLQQETFQLENVPGVLQEGDFDLGLEIYEGEASSFNVHIKYSPALYDRATIEGFFADYGVFLRAIGENPNGLTQELPAITDSERQQRLELRRQELAYWQDKLANLPESLDLATDFPRSNAAGFVPATHAVGLDASLTTQLERLAGQKGGTLFMVLLAAFKVLLYRYSSRNVLCVGTTSGANTLALRSQIDGDDSFSALLSQVKATCVEAFKRQDTPFAMLADWLRPDRNAAISPFFQAMLVPEGSSGSSGFLGVPRADLHLGFTETSGALVGSIEYNPALYKPQTIARMAEHFVALCRAVAAAPATKVRDVNFIGDAERQQVLTAFHGARAEYPADRCIHQLFAEQARMLPDHTAVTFGEQSLSYRELLDRTSALASYLQAAGVKPDSVVAICVEQSFDFIVGVLGVLQAGAAYVLVDAGDSDGRIAYILQDSQTAVVITQDQFQHRLRSLGTPKAKLIALDRQWPEIKKAGIAAKARRIELRRDVAPQHLAYVSYSAGAAGKPRGIAVEHQALVNRITSLQRRYALDASDVVLYSGHAAWELFWPLTVGASIVLAAQDQAACTTLHLTSDSLQTLLSAAPSCPALKRVFWRGEAPERKTLEQFRLRFPEASLQYFYGPAEAALAVTAYDCAQVSQPFVPIGKPIDNTEIYILDRHNRPQPIGVPGELHIAGDGLARGYLNLAQLTQETFAANPFQPGTRMYKTGDLARWLDDGNIQFLGRII
jgi:amino acid adenylation domain-containing protein